MTATPTPAPHDTVTTADQLDALPVGSVLISQRTGDAVQRFEVDPEEDVWEWQTTGPDGGYHRAEHLLVRHSPLTVLYRPDAPAPVAPRRNRLRDDPTPLGDLAASFAGTTEVDRLAITLMQAWAKADPESDVAQHPVSFVATFADMARAALASAPAPVADALRSEVEHQRVLNDVLAERNEAQQAVAYWQHEANAAPVAVTPESLTDALTGVEVGGVHLTEQEAASLAREAFAVLAVAPAPVAATREARDAADRAYLNAPDLRAVLAALAAPSTDEEAGR